MSGRAVVGVCRFALAALSVPGTAWGQQLEPRTYTSTPVEINFLIAGYAYSVGGLSVNPALKLTGAELKADTAVLAYVRSLDAWGNSAKFDAVVAGSCLTGSADVDGVSRTRDVCGLHDPAFRFSVNLFGAPALTLKEFASYRQDVVAGVSLQVLPPWGQYDPARLINLGTNRWTFRPEIGISKTIDSFTLELALGASIYSTNDDFFGGKKLEQDPMYSGQAHLIYQFRNGAWAALDGTYYAGGRTTVDGVRRDDRQKASRVGVTLALPVSRHDSVKLFGSAGVSIRTGTDYDILGMAWQHRWGVGL